MGKRTVGLWSLRMLTRGINHSDLGRLVELSKISQSMS